MIDYKKNSRETFKNLWSFYKKLLESMHSNKTYVYLMELKTHVWL